MKKIQLIKIILFLSTVHALSQEFAPVQTNPFGLLPLEDPASTLQLRYHDMDIDGDVDAVHFGLIGDSVVIAVQHNIGNATAPQFDDHQITVLESTEAFTLIFGDIGDIGDINNDGLPDLMVFGEVDSLRGYNCTYYQNISIGSQLEFETYRADMLGLPSVGDGVFFPDMVDMNGDGDLDVFMSGWKTEPITEEINGQFYYGQHRGNFSDISYTGWFTEAYGINFSDTFQAAIAAAGDLDGDDDVDLLSIIASTDTEFGYYFFENNPGMDGRPAFEAPVQNPFNLPDSLGIIDLSDVDGDGDLDLTVFQGESGISYFENTACINTVSDVIANLCEGEQITIGSTTFDTPGNYSVVILNAAGCDSTVQLQLNITTINDDVNSINMVLTAMESEADTYQWYDCDTGFDIIGATGRSFDPIVTGNYAVRIDKNNCTATSDCIFVDLSDVQSLSAIGVRLFPNPAQEVIYLEGINSELLQKIWVSDMQGTRLKTRINAHNRIELINFSSGTYILHVVKENKHYAQMFVKN